MTKEELLSQIGGASIEDLACQKDIKTEEQVLKLQKKSYMVTEINFWYKHSKYTDGRATWCCKSPF